MIDSEEQWLHGVALPPVVTICGTSRVIETIRMSTGLSLTEFIGPFGGYFVPLRLGNAGTHNANGVPQASGVTSAVDNAFVYNMRLMDLNETSHPQSSMRNIEAAASESFNFDCPPDFSNLPDGSIPTEYKSETGQTFAAQYGKGCSWFDSWFRRFCAESSFVPHEAHCQPICGIMVASSSELADSPFKVFDEMLQATSRQPGQCAAGLFDHTFPRVKLVLHDCSTNSSRIDTENLLSSISSVYSPSSCYVVTVNSAQQEFDPAVGEIWSRYNRDMLKKKSFPEIPCAQMSWSDVQGLAGFMESVAGLVVAPWLSRKLGAFDSIISQKRKGFRNQLKSFFKSAGGGGGGGAAGTSQPSASNALASSVGGAGLVGSNTSQISTHPGHGSDTIRTTPSGPDSNESINGLTSSINGLTSSMTKQVKDTTDLVPLYDPALQRTMTMYSLENSEWMCRVAGDLAFHAHDYRLALSYYRQISSDFKRAGAHMHAAGCYEMSAVCLALAVNAEHVDQDEASETLSEVFRLFSSAVEHYRLAKAPGFVIRATILSLRLCPAPSMALQAVSRCVSLQNKNSSDPVGPPQTGDLMHALLYEQLAVVYHKLGMTRKCVSFFLTSAQSFVSIQAPAYAARCLTVAFELVKRSGWQNLVNHVEFSLGRCHFLLNNHMKSLEHFMNLFKEADHGSSSSTHGPSSSTHGSSSSTRGPSSSNRDLSSSGPKGQGTLRAWAGQSDLGERQKSYLRGTQYMIYLISSDSFLQQSLGPSVDLPIATALFRSGKVEINAILACEINIRDVQLVDCKGGTLSVMPEESAPVVLKPGSPVSVKYENRAAEASQVLLLIQSEYPHQVYFRVPIKST